ncbi:MAG: tripartite tricarboxylate transporter substrate binding protein, partial [Acidobacteriota bacterium]
WARIENGGSGRRLGWPRRDVIKWGAALFASGFAGCRPEGPFPSAPIKLLVPYGSGGGTDLEARAIAPYVQKQLDTPIIVENQAGADGRLGLSRFAREASDGYKLAVYGIPSIILGEMLFDTPYKVRDFSHIYAWIRENQVLVTLKSRWGNLDSFLDEARRRKLSAGVTYLTSASRLAGLALAQEAKLQFSWIPFGSTGSSLAALLGGHVDFCISAATSCLSLVESGRISPILVFSEEKDPIYPDVPIPVERGYSLASIPIVRGVVAPPHLDADRQELLEKAFAAAAADPEFLAQAKKSNTPVTPMDSREYRQVVDSYYQKIDQYKELLLQKSEQG